MGGEGDRLEPPIPKSKERADTDTAEARFVPAFRAIQPPVEIFFRTIHVSNGIGFAMVGLLINDKPLGSGGDEGKGVVGAAVAVGVTDGAADGAHAASAPPPPPLASSAPAVTSAGRRSAWEALQAPAQATRSSASRSRS